MNTPRQALIKKIRANAYNSISDWKDVVIDKHDPELNPMMNNRCQFNALSEYRAKRAVGILEVVEYTKSHPIAHYINIDVNGETYDATLGWSYAGCKYKLSKHIHTMDVDNMNYHLRELKTKLFNMSGKPTLFLAKIFFIDTYDCF